MSRGDRHRELLAEAIRIAAHNVRSRRGGPFGALVVRDRKIVGRGANLVTSTNDPTAHAEMVAIRDACRRLGSFQLAGCDVYCSAEPCPMCLAALYWARPRRVYFAAGAEEAARAGFDDAYVAAELARAPEERSLAVRGLAVEGAGEPFRVWCEWEGRVEY